MVNMKTMKPFEEPVRDKLVEEKKKGRNLKKGRHEHVKGLCVLVYQHRYTAKEIHSTLHLPSSKT